ncbi:MazG nucleotide pyrophosphohydrolase domain-containing protein [Clostridium botulinum]|uniref:MazG nucleotide pyrophosphohydrolase domain-containing protein n=1 Tax=Clostridium botulinum TaxID=1491 RepID=UPI000EE90A39|nr:nucleotide pyrophosphohydrolase [Clostridium botulinum]
MDIKELTQKAYQNSNEKGFWEDWEEIKGSDKYKSIEIKTSEAEEDLINNAIGNRLMLITDEVSEAHEALRKKDYDNFKEELADIVIRVASLAGGLKIDLDKEIQKKILKNRKRPYKHNKAF